MKHEGEKISRQQRREQERKAKKQGLIFTEPLNPTNDYAVIHQAAEKLNVNAVSSEALLWKPHDMTGPDSIPPLNEDTLIKAANNWKTSLSLMKESANPHLNNSAAFLTSLVDSQDVKLLFENKSGDNERTPFMGIRFQISPEQQSYHWLFTVNPQLLAISPHFYSSVSIDHEVKHLKDFIKLQKSMPQDTSLQRRLNYHSLHLQDDQLYMRDEARGWGEQCQAIIYQDALGYLPKLPPDILRFTAIYARLGSNPDGEEWTEFVAKEIFKKPHFKLK